MDAEAIEQHIEWVRAQVEAQGYNRLVGARVEELAYGSCVMSVVKRPDLLQMNGFFHGGVTAFLIDSGTATAAMTVLRPDQAALTAEYKLNLLSPALGERLVCRARVVKPGRMLVVVSADVFSVAGGQEKRTATALVPSRSRMRLRYPLPGRVGRREVPSTPRCGEG